MEDIGQIMCFATISNVNSNDDEKYLKLNIFQHFDIKYAATTARRSFSPLVKWVVSQAPCNVAQHNIPILELNVHTFLIMMVFRIYTTWKMFVIVS